MNVNIIVLYTLIIFCSGSDIFTAKRFDGTPIGPYKLKKIGHIEDFSSGQDINSFDEESSLDISELGSSSKVKTKFKTSNDSTFNNITSYYFADHIALLDPLISQNMNSSMNAYITRRYQTEFSNLSSSSVTKRQLNSSIPEDSVKENPHGLTYEAENSCISDCAKSSPSIIFSVNPMISHFISGSSITLLCKLLLKKSLISQMYFEFEGMQFFGPICKQNRRNADECINFPSTEWKIITNETEPVYAEELTIIDLDDALSGYYDCVVDLKCCGRNGTYLTNIRGMLPFSISVDSFSQYRTAIIVLGTSVILIFAISTFLLCKRNFCHNVKPLHVFNRRVGKNRSQNGSLLASAPPDELNKFIP